MVVFRRDYVPSDRFGEIWGHAPAPRLVHAGKEELRFDMVLSGSFSEPVDSPVVVMAVIAGIGEDLPKVELRFGMALIGGEQNQLEGLPMVLENAVAQSYITPSAY